MSDAPGTVVGAVIVADGRVLAARRTRPVELAGLWEFPGGKVEPGEDPRAALVREVREELGATVSVGDEVVGDASPWVISERHVLRLFLASVTSGDLQPGPDHDRLSWLEDCDLGSVEWLPTDGCALAAVERAIARL